MAAFKVEKGTLKIELDEFVGLLGNAERRELAKMLCADEHLFKAVLECVADDSKYAGHYFSDDEDGPWWFSHRTVLEMREKLIPMMPEVSRLAAEEALRQRDDAQIKERLADKWAWKLFHAWPEEHWQRRPNSETRGYLNPCRLCGAEAANKGTNMLLCTEHLRVWSLWCDLGKGADPAGFVAYLTSAAK